MDRVEPRPGGMTVLRLFLKTGDAVIVGDFQHAEPAGLRRRHLMVAMVMSALCVRCQSSISPVVHLVDVIAGEDQGSFGRFGFDALEILKDGVGGALVPVRMHPLHGRNDFDVLAQSRARGCSSRRGCGGSVRGICTVLGLRFDVRRS